MFGKDKIEQLLYAVLGFFMVGAEVFADGKFTLKDLLLVNRAIDDIEEIIELMTSENLALLNKQINELDAAEKEAIFAGVSDRLKLKDPVTEELVERVIKAVINDYDLYQDIKQKRSDYSTETVAE